MKRIFFDVGAFSGGESGYVSQEPSWEVHAFEPNPTLAEMLPDRPNYIINHAAVSEHDGEADFYIDDLHPECSSLLPIVPNGKGAYGVPIVATRVIKVRTIRLDTYIRERGITRIDILNIDAQGGDLSVLRSLGDCIGIVQCIKCESMIKPLYHEQCYRLPILKYLTLHGFHLSHIHTLEDNMAEDLTFYPGIIA